jgi:hypothetical protein
MLTVVDPSGVEQFIKASDNLPAILELRDTMRQFAGRFQHYRVCDDEGLEVERDEDA